MFPHRSPADTPRRIRPPQRAYFPFVSRFPALFIPPRGRFASYHYVETIRKHRAVFPPRRSSAPPASIPPTRFPPRRQSTPPFPPLNRQSAKVSGSHSSRISHCERSGIYPPPASAPLSKHRRSKNPSMAKRGSPWKRRPAIPPCGSLCIPPRGSPRKSSAVPSPRRHPTFPVYAAARRRFLPPVTVPPSPMRGAGRKKRERRTAAPVGKNRFNQKWRTGRTATKAETRPATRP